MHELSVTEDLIRTLDRECEEKGIEKIKKINLVIGELSGMIGECVQIYFDLLSEGHPFEKAELSFTYVKASFKCSSCGAEFPGNREFKCPSCGGKGKLIKGTGREFYVKSVET